jgi:hypothetical protein
MAVVDKEFARSPLQDKPGLVVREDRAGPVEFCYVDSAGLRAWRCKGNLEGVSSV